MLTSPLAAFFLVDREGLAAHRFRHGECLQLQCLALERGIERRDAARGNQDVAQIGIESNVIDLDPMRTGGNMRKAEAAVGVGVGNGGGAENLDDRTLERFAGGGVGHAAGEGAGGLGGGDAAGATQQEQEGSQPAAQVLKTVIRFHVFRFRTRTAAGSELERCSIGGPPEN